MLRKSTNLLLTRTLSSCLQNLIKKPHIGLTEVSFKKHTQNCVKTISANTILINVEIL